MLKDRRKQIIDIVTREFIGPDPIDFPRLRQDNGEEILTSDPPLIRYVAGILYPRQTSYSTMEHSVENFETTDENNSDNSDDGNIMSVSEEELSGTKNEYLEDAEELLNLSNAYRQSAISITVSLNEATTIDVEIYAGVYTKIATKDPETSQTRTHYYRKQLKWSKNDIPLPNEKQGISREPVRIDGKIQGCNLI